MPAAIILVRCNATEDGVTALACEPCVDDTDRYECTDDHAGTITLTRSEKLWERRHEDAAIIASKPSVAKQAIVRADREKPETGRSTAMRRGLSCTRPGSHIGEAEAGNLLKTGVRKSFAVR